MLSAADLAGMRETVLEALPDTCTVVDRANLSDGGGGHTLGTAVETTYACRIAPRLATGTGQLKDAEMEQSERVMSQSPWLITMPYGAVVTNTSEVRDSAGRMFSVFAVLARRSDELHTAVLARLINEGAG